jgi:hypothetical protein
MTTIIEEKRNLAKELKRINRLARLYLITHAYNSFAQRNLYSVIAKSENNYRDAEKWADLSNFIFGDVKHATPQDFMHDKNEMADKSIGKHEEYVHALELADSYSNSFKLNSKTVDTFCRSIEYGYKSKPEGKYRYKCSMFKSIGHVQYPGILGSCIYYMCGHINMDEFKRQFVWFGFSMKREPVNIRQFIRQMNEIEELYEEIESKRNSRKKVVPAENSDGTETVTGTTSGEITKKLMKPTVIKTESDNTLTVRTVTPYINDGKVKQILKKEFCLLIEEESYNEDGSVENSHKLVLLDKEGAKQLIGELTEFIQTPF